MARGSTKLGAIRCRCTLLTNAIYFSRGNCQIESSRARCYLSLAPGGILLAGTAIDLPRSCVASRSRNDAPKFESALVIHFGHGFCASDGLRGRCKL